VFFKFLLFFLGGIYLLRLVSPFLFKLLITRLIRKNTRNAPNKSPKSPTKKKTTSDSLGEYIDYEEVD
jgi:hypothetical protein|tara:strand:- start:577 stop:780 length:204 start_codon:yes stop_codon:yes gene_type:complete